MNYQPQSQPPRGFNPMVRKLLNGRCDVCGKSRSHYKHDKCAKARKAAGFKYWDEPAASTPMTCVQCNRVFRYDAMAGNCCRGCFAVQFGQATGREVSNG